jgi:exodeoxyribonuclease-5
MPQPGERVICCRNNREEGLFNGGLGTLLALADVGHGTLSLDVQMDDLAAPNRELQVDPYLFRRHFTNGDAQKLPRQKGMPWLQEFDWGLVLTAHKAQGSSWDDVTVVDDSAAFRENRAKWLYTAVTRAERGLTVLLRGQ